MKNLFTYKEIKEKIKSNDYNAEMLLMHLLTNFEKLEQERDEVRRELQGVKLRLSGYQRKYDDAIACEYEEDRKLDRKLEQLTKERDEARYIASYWRNPTKISDIKMET